MHMFGENLLLSVALPVIPSTLDDMYISVNTISFCRDHCVVQEGLVDCF
jgi:hypothetical protein